MPQVDYIVVGLGIAGTLISYELRKAGYAFTVIDLPSNAIASRVAGAVINPVNVNSLKPLTDSQQYIPAAIKTYQELEAVLQKPILSERSMLLFRDEKAVEREWLYRPEDEELTLLENCFSPTHYTYRLSPLWQVHADNLLNGWRSLLQQHNQLIEESFDHSLLQITDSGIRYRDYGANQIIFCEGAGVRNNPYFQQLPFTRNRGEALLLRIPGLSTDYIYHHKLRLIPAGDDIFWCGSNYTWSFQDLSPNEEWSKYALTQLQNWLKLPFVLKDHIVAERPTTAGQKPIIGRHPQYSAIKIFNGLGTRGFSIGPLLAKQIL